MAMTTKSGNVSKGLESSPGASDKSAGKTTDGLTDQESGTGGKVGPSSGTATDDQEKVASYSSQLDDGGGANGDEAPGGTDDAQVKMDDGMGGGQPGAAPAGGGIMQQVAAILQQAIQLLQGGGAPPAPTAPPEMPQQDLAPVSGMSSGRVANRLQAAQVEKIILRAVLPLQTQVASLTAQNKKIEGEAKFKAMVARAHAQLEGWTIDSDVEASLFKAAKYGQEMLDEAVKLVQMTNPVNPPSDPAAFEAMMAETPGGDEVSTFAAAHPGQKNQEWIRAQSKQWKDYIDATSSSITLKAWLETNMKSQTEKMRG